MAGMLEGKVAVVTGAGSGIGRASSLMFAREGAKVVVSDIVSEGGEETVGMIKDQGGEAIFVRTDVSQAPEVEALIKETVKRFDRLDCAHNNAGIFGMGGPTVECTEENWDRITGVNLKGVWLCMKYEIPQMLKQGKGTIVNTASAAGLTGLQGLPAYVASKHGVVGLTKAAAYEYAQSGIRINSVAPGVIRTRMTQDRIDEGGPEIEARLNSRNALNRMGTPEEVAEAVMWLCSDAASFVTGQTIPVDGAWLVGLK